jgi:hypothetical protein
VRGEHPMSSPAADDLRCVRVLASAAEGLLDPIVDAFRAVWAIGVVSNVQFPLPGWVGAHIMRAAPLGPCVDGHLPFES